MLALACTLYLPDHLAEISRRTYYYFAGEGVLHELSNTAEGVASKASETVMSAVTTAYQAAANATEAAQEAVSHVAETVG